MQTSTHETAIRAATERKAIQRWETEGGQSPDGDALDPRRALDGQTIIVTGGASGIGKYTALELAMQGAAVLVADLDIDNAVKVSERIVERGGRALPIKIDVSVPEQVELMVDVAAEQFGSLHGIFNNAGIGANKPFLELDPATYHKVIDVNQHSVYYGMYYAARKMVALGTSGTFVNTTSIYGTMAALGSFNYHAAKAAVIMMTRSAALELAPHNIRVVAVAPGFIDTPILGEDAAFKASLAKQHLHGELIAPEKVASVVAFLFTSGAEAINGATIPIEDGYQVFKNS